jgi:hypothetical protein
MIWTFLALLLIVHGALSRWVQAGPAHPVVSTTGDVLLIAIGLLTVDQLQGLGVADILRVGLFFVAFGYSGRRLMSSLLSRPA